MDARFVYIDMPGRSGPPVIAGANTRIARDFLGDPAAGNRLQCHSACTLCWVTLMPGSVMTAGLHHGVVTEDIRLRILECTHPRWYDHLIRLSHKLSVD